MIRKTPQLQGNTLRVFTTTEYARFSNFREGGSSVTNPGGNEATISNTTTFMEYGVSNNLTLSVLVPYVHKVQKTNRFGKRVASGISDITLFGRYDVARSFFGNGPSVSVGLGLKFANGGIEEPQSGESRLPPAFQIGSGGYDLIPTLAYYHGFGKFSLFGNTFARLPVNDNKFGYRFGREYEVHFGIQYPLPFWQRRVELLASADALFGGRDTDSGLTLPGRVREGSTVLNTGGRFLDLTPGVRIRATEDFSIQARFFLPTVEDWNGRRSLNVGQVAPDLTVQISVAYQFKMRPVPTTAAIP